MFRRFSPEVLLLEPVLIGILFADHVIIEQQTNKKSLIGTFNQFFARNFPMTFPPWTVFIAVDNIEGEFDFSLNLVNDKNDQIAVAISGKMKAEDRSKGTELVFRIVGAVFPTAGLYNLTFKIDGVPVGSRTVPVQLMPQGGPSDG